MSLGRTYWAGLLKIPQAGKILHPNNWLGLLCIYLSQAVSSALSVINREGRLERSWALYSMSPVSSPCAGLLICHFLSLMKSGLWQVPFMKDFAIHKTYGAPPWFTWMFLGIEEDLLLCDSLLYFKDTVRWMKLCSKQLVRFTVKKKNTFSSKEFLQIYHVEAWYHPTILQIQVSNLKFLS